MNYQRKLLTTFSLVILLTVLLKVIVPSPVNSKDRIRDFWIIKTHQTKKYDVAIAGDSRIYRGFSVRAFENTVNKDLDAVNLGYSSAGFDPDYLKFTAGRIDPKSENKILILGVTPYSLTEEAAQNKQFNNLLKTDKLRILMSLYISPFSNFFEIYQPSEIFGKSSINYHQDYKSTGWVASYKDSINTVEALPEYRKQFIEHKVSPKLEAEFISTVDDFIKDGIKVVAFRPPSTLKMRQLEDSLSGFSEEDFVNELEKIGVKWITFRDEDFVSYDGSHLHYKSAEDLSRKIGEEVNKLLEN